MIGFNLLNCVNKSIWRKPMFKVLFRNSIAIIALGLFFNPANAQTLINIEEAIIPAGIDSMGDHFNFGDPVHPSDEKPIHAVKTDSFYMAKNITTNQQFLNYLNNALTNGVIEVIGDTVVHPVGSTDKYCYLNQYQSYYSIAYNGSVFSIADFRANHPMVGVLWDGAAAYCNWLSQQNGLQPCYNLTTWDCDFSKNGYRLPTEAEWEWAARGGHTNPYMQYPNGDTAVKNQANIPNSGDPYETGPLPNTTPVGFYDGTLKLKSVYNWPGAATSYQTGNGVNAFGLFDMQGNVWQYCNDWYGNTYYSTSPYANPTGPTMAEASIMPDGLPYRVQRGGNWWNGDMVYGVDDGHSRVSNRDPLYYRGPGGPWHQEGFRTARKYTPGSGIKEINDNGIQLEQNYPNPFNSVTTISFVLVKTESVSLEIYNSLGEKVSIIVNEILNEGKHNFDWNASDFPSGIYSYKLVIEGNSSIKKMILIK